MLMVRHDTAHFVIIKMGCDIHWLQRGQLMSHSILLIGHKTRILSPVIKEIGLSGTISIRIYMSFEVSELY